MKFKGYIAKRKAENFLMFPFILLGRLLAILDPLPKEYNTFFFFPFYHTGGAEKVHSLIAKAAGDSDCIIFFTRRSTDDAFLNDFKSTGCDLLDISRYIDNKWLYFLKFIWRGKITGYINRQHKKPMIFNGQSNFGYKISPWIDPSVKQVELIHSFNTFSWIRVPFIPFITTTVMISKRRIDEHLQQYENLGIPADYINRIRFVANAIEMPEHLCNKDFTFPLRVLFVGRGTTEKRPEIFIEIARLVPGAVFTLVGEMPQPVLYDLPSNTTATGNVHDISRLHEIYCAHHLLIIPSSTEGFPIVLMEAMARGCAVMATPVGDIPYHINENNGYLFSTTGKESVVNEAVLWIQQLTPGTLQSLSASAKEYAGKNFSIGHFNQQYQTILQQ